jgi:homoprotocatechuate degradation regulator HpaR
MREGDAPLYGPDYNNDERYLGKLRDLPVKLHRTREAFASQFKEVFQLHKLTDQQFRVLRILSRRDMLETGQLAQLTMLLGPSLSRILKDLAKRGLVTRHNTSADGRVSHHRLTPEARHLIDQIVPEFDPLYEALAERITSDEVVELNRLLDKLQAALREITFEPKLAD